MTGITIFTGIILTILGAGAYLGTGSQSITALIPSFFGIVILLLGTIARKESIRKHIMHAAVGVALLGFIGSVSGIPKVFSLVGGTELARPAAAITQAIMALICLVYLILAIRSFISARRNPDNK